MKNWFACVFCLSYLRIYNLVEFHHSILEEWQMGLFQLFNNMQFLARWPDFERVGFWFIQHSNISKICIIIVKSCTDILSGSSHI